MAARIIVARGIDQRAVALRGAARRINDAALTADHPAARAQLIAIGRTARTEADRVARVADTRWHPRG